MKSLGSQVKSLVTQERETLHPFLRRVERRTLGTTNLSALPVPGKIMEQIFLEAMLKYKDEELVGWSHPEGSGQRLNVQMEISDKWCPSGVCTGTSAL